MWTPPKNNPRDLWPLRHLFRVMKRHDLTKKYLPTYIPTHLPTWLPTYLCTSIREHPKGAIIGTCDIWDTDYNTDNWEPGFMTIFVNLQLVVTLDSIRNSCDVWSMSFCLDITLIQGSQVPKVTLCVQTLKWQSVTHKGRHRAARAAKSFRVAKMHSQDDFSMVLWVKFFIPWLKRVCILVIISVSNASKCSRPLLGCWAWKAQFLVFTPDIRTLEHCCLSRAKWISEKPLQFLLLRLHFCLPDNGLGWVLNNVQWTREFNRQHCHLFVLFWVTLTNTESETSRLVYNWRRLCFLSMAPLSWKT